jgi:hypothetical protein
MNALYRSVATVCVSGLLVCASAATGFAQTSPDQYKPTVGQPGKDAVWVPTAPALVEKMLDMAKVTPKDFVMDLGSGDGRNIIAAAKRGARGVGVEYNNDLVVLSNRLAAEAGVADKAKFVQGDMYAADISQATVLALFLLTENMDRMVQKFLSLKPGTRIVVNTFGITGWTPDETERLEQDCTNWCTSQLWIVPAKVEGSWQLAEGDVTFKQDFQMLSGGLTRKDGSKASVEGRLRGEQIRFTIDGAEYEGRVNGNSIEGTVSKGASKSAWKATRSR